MMRNTSHQSSRFQTSSRTKREGLFQQTVRFETHANGCWAILNLGVDNILGYGGSKEEALVDLAHRIAGFVEFLKKAGRNVPEWLS